MRLLVFAILITSPPLLLWGEMNVIIGEGKVLCRVYSSKNISVKNDNLFKVTLTTYPQVEELFFNQTINNYRIRWNSPFKTKRSLVDRFSNEIAEVYFKPIRYNNRYTTISYEISFDVTLNTTLYEIENVDVFPIKEKFLTPYESQFLSNGNGIGFTDSKKEVRYQLKMLKETSYLAETVILVMQWVNKNIKLYHKKNAREDVYRTLLTAEYRPYFNSEAVFKSKVGTRLGRMNLLTAMLRTIGIPTRVVSGLSIDHAINVGDWQTNDLNITVLSAGKEDFWLEVFFPRFGWLPLNLDGENLFYLPNKIKKRVGLDFLDLLEFDRSDKYVIEEYFFEKKETLGNFKIMEHFEVGSGFIFIPPMNIDKLNKILKKSSWLEAIPYEPYKEFILGKEIDSIKISQSPLRRYAQKIKVQSPNKLTSIGLSLLKLDDLTGKMVLELYSNNEGQIGKLAATSEPVPVNKLKVQSRFTWLYFKFRQTNFSPEIGESTMWLIPKISGKAIVHWGLHIDHNRGWIRDSYKISDDHAFVSLLNGDFAYRLKMRE